MNHHYADITNKMGEPLWWDEHAVPRYCEFGPHETADIYADVVALLLIECQDCGREFKVCMSGDSPYGDRKTLKELIESDEIHYGDPPNYGCCAAGPTMNSIPRRVLEFWDKQVSTWGDARRVPDLEREITCDWAADA